MPPMPATIIHTSITRDWREVYAFIADPGKMPLWASGLSSGLTRDGDEWIAPGPLGNARVRFAPDNDFGVVDHTVTLESGQTVHNALRVVPNGDGAEVMFILLRAPGMSDAQFATDAAWVEKDLAALKSILETDEDRQTETEMSSKENDRRIDYIELNVADIAASKAFYGSAFGWSFTDYGPEYCEFADGRLTGGFTTLGPVNSGGGPLVILYADDLEDAQVRVETAGGKIVKPIYSFPGGRRFHFADPDGYELAIWSAK